MWMQFHKNPRFPVIQKSTSFSLCTNRLDVSFSKQKQKSKQYLDITKWNFDLVLLKICLKSSSKV